MSAHILALLDRLIGSRPSGRSAAADFGPPPAVLHPALASFTDAQLLAVDRATLIATADALAEARLRTQSMRPAARTEASR